MRARNQVFWRLAYCRLAILARAMASGSDTSPLIWATNSGAPIALVQGAASFQIARLSRTSSRAPAAIIASNLASIRSHNQSRAGRRTSAVTCDSGISGAPVSACHSASPRPVARSTSQARWTRAGLFRSIRRRVGSSRSRPIAARSRTCRSASARISGAIGGISARPSVSARKYSPVPPTMIGRLPVFSSCATSRSQWPTE